MDCLSEGVGLPVVLWEVPHRPNHGDGKGDQELSTKCSRDVMGGAFKNISAM
jgi:hypothetical protein